MPSKTYYAMAAGAAILGSAMSPTTSPTSSARSRLA